MADFMEAPASATVKIKTPSGFQWMFTIRDMTASGLIMKIKQFEDVIDIDGWVPDGLSAANTTGTAPKVDQDSCKHEKVTTKQSSGHNKPENKGRYYKACLDCNKFLGWED